jgi:hypothetical protein
LMCSIEAGKLSKALCKCPPMRSLSIGAEPRYGTWTASTPASRLGRSTLVRPNHQIHHQSYGHSRAKSVTRDRPTSLSLHLKIP